MTCHLGDFTEYAALRRELADLENAASRQKTRARRSATEESLERLRAGDVVDVPQAGRPGCAVVVAPDPQACEPRPTILTLDKQIRRLGIARPGRTDRAGQPDPDPQAVQRQAAQGPP